MSTLQSNWNKYAQNTLTPIIRAHYFFTVWRNYLFLLHKLPISGDSLLEIGSSTGQISLRLVKKYQLTPKECRWLCPECLIKNKNKNTKEKPNFIKASILLPRDD